MPRRTGGRRYDERGIALSSPIALVSLAAVVLAGVAFVSTNGETDQAPDTARPVTAAPSPTRPTETAKKTVVKEKPKKKAVRRDDVFVEVYNNSGIAGLAGSTADRIAGAGWQVVGSETGTAPSPRAPSTSRTGSTTRRSCSPRTSASSG